MVSVEALVRGHTPDGRRLSRRDARARGVPRGQQALDAAVLRQACLDMGVLLAERGRDGLHAANVNLTPSSLIHPALDRLVLGTLAECGLPAEHLRIEVPETAAFADLAEAADTLRRMTSAGVALTLDDVGVEGIGLRYLSSLTIDGLKIDRTFVTRMLTGASELAVVRLMVDICAGLGIRLTAEGVERCAQVEVLRALGVRAIQGHHVARPMPLDQSAVRAPARARPGLPGLLRPPGPAAPPDPTGVGGAAGAQRAAVPSV